MLRKYKVGKKVLIVLGGIVGLIVFSMCGLMLLTGGAMFLDAVKQNLTWREDTIPLSRETISDLCGIFSIDDDDPRCNETEEEVYGPDFFPEVHKTFTPQEGAWASIDDVEAMIGVYEYECEPIEELGDGTKYYVCAYDFAGDRVFPVAIFFYSDGRIMRLVANIAD